MPPLLADSLGIQSLPPALSLTWLVLVIPGTGEWSFRTYRWLNSMMTTRSRRAYCLGSSRNDQPTIPSSSDILRSDFLCRSSMHFDCKNVIMSSNAEKMVVDYIVEIPDFVAWDELKEWLSAIPLGGTVLAMVWQNLVCRAYKLLDIR